MKIKHEDIGEAIGRNAAYSKYIRAKQPELFKVVRIGAIFKDNGIENDEDIEEVLKLIKILNEDNIKLSKVTGILKALNDE